MKIINYRTDPFPTNVDACLWIVEGSNSEPFTVTWANVANGAVTMMDDQHAIVSATLLAGTSPSLLIQDNGVHPNYTNHLGGEYKIDVLKVELDPIPALDRFLSNLGAEDPVPEDSSIDVVAEVTPDIPGIVVQFEVFSADPSLDDNGNFLQQDGIAEPLGDGRYKITFIAKTEPKEEKCATSQFLQDQSITIRAQVLNCTSDKMGISVLSRFRYLVNNERQQAAIDYVDAKYDLSVGAIYSASPSGLVFGNPGLVRGSTAPISGSVGVHEPAFSTENLGASTLIHEQIHVDQGAVRRLNANADCILYLANVPDAGCVFADVEIEAYSGELVEADDSCITFGEKADILSEMQVFFDIEDEVGCE